MTKRMVLPSEALGVLERRLTKLRVESYSDLVAEWLDRSYLEQIPGESGVAYWVKHEGFCDDPRQEGGNWRIFGLLDDGGWRPFAPLTDSSIPAPDGSFIGEWKRGHAQRGRAGNRTDSGQMRTSPSSAPAPIAAK